MKKLTYLLFLCSLITFGQGLVEEEDEDALGSWFMYFGKHRVADKWSIHTEAQYRTYEFGNNFNQLLLRTGINYDISEKVMVTLGYGNITTDGTFIDVDDEKNSNENRIYQQLVIRNNFGKLNLSHRYRLEQRFIDNNVTGNVTQHRARYFLKATYPIGEKWYLAAYDEIFINLQEPLFGQNRLYGAIGHKLNDNIKIEVGYLRNHFTEKEFKRLQFGIWWTTDWRKDKS